MAKLLSIIIPFRHETDSQLIRAVSTIDNQIGIDFNQIEVLLVGDGVSLRGEKLFANFKRFNLTILGYASSQGAGVARQMGIDRTTGKYFMFMDGDDVLRDVFVLRDFIATLNSTGDHQLVIAQYTHQARRGNSFTYFSSAEHDWKAAYAKLFNRDFIEQIGLRWAPDLRVYEDTYFVGSACMLATDIQYIKRSVYVWLWNPTSTVRMNHHAFNHQLHAWARSYQHTLTILRRQRPSLRAGEFYNYVADLFFRQRQFPPADAVAFREEQIKLLAQNRDLWTATGKQTIKRMIQTMTTPGHQYVGESIQGADAYLLRQEALLFQAFRQIQQNQAKGGRA